METIHGKSVSAAVIFKKSSNVQKVSATSLEKMETQRMKKELEIGGRKKVKELEQDAEDDQNDKELMDILKTTKLINDYTSADLVGKERRTYLQQRMVELGAKDAFKPAKVSLPMHIGMKKKALERVDKQIQKAKDFGTYKQSMKKDLSKKEVALTRGAAAASSGGKRQLDKGIVGSVGRIRHGVMKVSKKVIESVENRGRGAFGKKGKSLSSSKSTRTGTRVST